MTEKNYCIMAHTSVFNGPQNVQIYRSRSLSKLIIMKREDTHIPIELWLAQIALAIKDIYYITQLYIYREIINAITRSHKSSSCIFLKKFFKWEGNFCFCFSESMFRFKCITKVEEEEKYALCAI
jgi:hypothetical protein